MIRYLLDTNIVIYALTGHRPRMRARFEGQEPGSVALSAITMAEVAVGLARDRPPSREALDAFLAVYPVLPFDRAAAEAYARLPFRRARFDRLLAAHALSLAAAVVTNNPGDFADVAGLAIENWAD